MTDRTSPGPDIIIYHNPACGTSRNTLAMIRNAGIEPHVIEYLKTPPARSLLASLIERMGVSVRSVLREKGTPFKELGLDDASLTDSQLLDAMMAHPILINRPIVVSPRRREAMPPFRSRARSSSQPSTGRLHERGWRARRRCLRPSRRP